MKYFGIFIIILISILSVIISERVKILFSGLKGESGAIKILKKLPKSFTIFSNVILEKDGYFNETDFIIIGNNGVFVLEIKNHNGIIVGNDNDHFWKQIKITENNGRYVNQFYSPIKQVGNHVHKLSCHLKDNGFYGWIQGLVWFTNAQCNLKIKARRVPVLRPNDDIVKFIVDYEPKKRIGDKEKRRLIKLMKPLIKKEIRGA